MKITGQYTTACIVGYNGPVSRYENPSAHGGVCLIQVRRSKEGLLARKVNSNGRHQEIGKPFVPTQEQIEHWETINKESK